VPGRPVPAEALERLQEAAEALADIDGRIAECNRNREALAVMVRQAVDDGIALALTRLRVFVADTLRGRIDRLVGSNVAAFTLAPDAIGAELETIWRIAREAEDLSGGRVSAVAIFGGLPPDLRRGVLARLDMREG
jgi:hypothetical protein